MIPSFVAQNVRESVVQYLTTTFALADDSVKSALDDFLRDQSDGIFRGPFLRVRMPFTRVDTTTWESPLEWTPEWFTPYIHQSEAWARLNMRGAKPGPTIVTTGTGSGKTECFLFPVLDHCVRQVAQGKRGIKALVLYPMNALAGDQANRLAGLLANEPGLAGVKAGLFIGGDGRNKTASENHLVDDANALLADPPDILLTNYKMLDRLLLRKDRHKLWAANEPETLRFVVLDEFHTYDGAQGTDVAMLLRRLGSALGMSTPGAPLGSATPVATSATLGSGAGSRAALTEFASKVFGVEFDDDAVIGESRQTVEEACGAIDYTLPIPSVEDVVQVDLTLPDAHDELAKHFIGNLPADNIELGDKLKGHHLTRALVATAGEGSSSWSAVRAAVAARVPDWGAVAQSDPKLVDEAITRYAALISIARRRDPSGGDRHEPLFPVEVQVWIREVSRLLRSVSTEPTFSWFDDGRQQAGEDEALRLPAVYCRYCGRSGWMARASELDHSLKTDSKPIYESSIKNSPQIRALIKADQSEELIQWLDPETGDLSDSESDAAVPVLVTGVHEPEEVERHARDEQCPSCLQDGAIRFIGSRVASLASVSISQLFSESDQNVDQDERKLLAFTPSVQDAAHRAAFFAGRTHRFNQRIAVTQRIPTDGVVNLGDLAIGVGDSAESGDARGRFALVPPDLLRDPEVRTVWTDRPTDEGLKRLRTRLALEVQLEFGLRARFGRTIELSDVAGAYVSPKHHLGATIDLVQEAHQHVAGQAAIPGTVAGYETYVAGLLERLRRRGAISHVWLDDYIRDDGNQWHIWGGRVSGMLAFPKGQSRPAFLTTGTSQNFDALKSSGRALTWYSDWARRTLGVELAQTAEVNRRAFEVLADNDIVKTWNTKHGATVYGLEPDDIAVELMAEGSSHGARCSVCWDRMLMPESREDDWVGKPCLRYRCTGKYISDSLDLDGYYRRLYREGKLRRVVTAEHTSMLDRESREDLEKAFRSGSEPDDPNVITATPTLEMGIDIGDLSSVMLTSIPKRQASFVQQVGRAGRKSGNSLVLTFARSDPTNLYYLADPAAMLAGDVLPPNCFLDAIEILRRQYFGFLIGRVATGEFEAPDAERLFTKLLRTGREDDGWLAAVIAESEEPSGRHVGDFVNLFGDQITNSVAARLREFASTGLRETVDLVLDQALDSFRDLERRRDRLKKRIEELEAKSGKTSEEEADLNTLRGERSAAIKLIQQAREENTLSAFERLGLLPNYTLIDDAVTLVASLWWKDDEGFESQTDEYERDAKIAIREFAPGSPFYVRGHRLRVDALEIGTANEPLHSEWRLCPECGYGAESISAPGGKSCPRCGQDTFSDAGALHELVPLKKVFCTSSEEQARVDDDSDERERLNFSMVTSVDVDPKDVVEAHELIGQDVAFGVEYARTATIRSVNLGKQEASGHDVRVSGTDVNAAGFQTCAHCGAVAGAKENSRQREHHRGWCPVRSGAKSEKWVSLGLVHELRTEAVRMLLPVSTLDVPERLASFKASLMLGLRLSFGGAPDYLRAIVTEFPNEGGGSKKLLVLHDTVPGGTGYIGRLGDPEQLREILESARTFISRCSCQAEGKQACHRCLLSEISPDELESVSRSVALELLDELLADWKFKTPEAGTVVKISLSRVEESELERRFKRALQEWAARDERRSMESKGKKAGGDAFELIVPSPDGSATRWEMEEQVHEKGAAQTIPDFKFTRQDQTGNPVVVYLDGFKYHASEEHNRLAKDSYLRANIRAKGSRVWNLTWDDVKAFHEAVASSVTKQPPQIKILTPKQRLTAEQAHHQRGAGLDLKTVDDNPMLQLLDFLATPDATEWEALALSALAGCAASGDREALPREAIHEALDRALRYDPPPAGEDSQDPWAIEFGWVTPHELSIRAFLNTSGERTATDECWTVALTIPDDSDSLQDIDHSGRWHDYLRWANLIQFLSSNDREAIVTTRAAAGDVEATDLVICPSDGATKSTVQSQSDSPSNDLPEDLIEDLELTDDSRIQELVRSAYESTQARFEVGYELSGDGVDGVPIEIAWPDARVAILNDGENELVKTLASAGWTARTVTAWDSTALKSALAES